MLEIEVQDMSVTIEVSEEIAAQVRELVESGQYPDADAAVREAIQALRRHRQILKLREMVAEADAEIERGESDLWTPELNERLMEEARGLYRSGAGPDPDVCP
jgi:putative addiction module CopG family antidote